jgi:hypothetical protein
MKKTPRKIEETASFLYNLASLRYTPPTPLNATLATLATLCEGHYTSFFVP